MSWWIFVLPEHNFIWGQNWTALLIVCPKEAIIGKQNRLFYSACYQIHYYYVNSLGSYFCLSWVWYNSRIWCVINITPNMQLARATRNKVLIVIRMWEVFLFASKINSKFYLTLTCTLERQRCKSPICVIMFGWNHTHYWKMKMKMNTSCLTVTNYQ